MSTRIQVDVKGILSVKGVELTAQLNGSVEEALEAFRVVHPDLHFVESMLKPVLMLKIPGHQYYKLVEVHKGKFYITCSTQYLKFIMGYCELMKIDYQLS